MIWNCIYSHDTPALADNAVFLVYARWKMLIVVSWQRRRRISQNPTLNLLSGALKISSPRPICITQPLLNLQSMYRMYKNDYQKSPQKQLPHMKKNKKCRVHVATRTLRGTWVCSASSGSVYLRVGRQVGANSSSTSIMGSWNGDTSLTDSALDDLRSTGELSGWPTVSSYSSTSISLLEAITRVLFGI